MSSRRYWKWVLPLSLILFAFDRDSPNLLLPVDYDPLAKAIASTGRIRNYEATVPPQCYTKAEGISNPCWTCHTKPVLPNELIDWDLQQEYAFSDQAMTNHWRNLFRDRRPEMAKISTEEVLSYIRTDNYRPLRAALEGRDDYPGYVPDLSFALGFDEEGFARDGSDWRAFRYKPFLGTFWPTNGSTDDVMIRLPMMFRTLDGNDSREIYKVNLAILEAAIAAGPMAGQKQDFVYPVEPLNEDIAGMDLNGDGEIGGMIHEIRCFPEHYAGDAVTVAVVRYIYPKDTEFLHSVRYVDPGKPDLIATRMKELRYSRKRQFLDSWALSFQYEHEYNEKENNQLPVFAGSPMVGLLNSFGWQLQGFIEDENGRLRLQTHEEHQFCMGCHSALGVTVDQTFSFARKVPGRSGWAYQDIRGIKDVPQQGHDQPEIAAYFHRVRGGDEFRANDEMLERYWKDDTLNEALVARAAPGGDRDIAWLVAPSEERALQLNRAYMLLVRDQTFTAGRDAVVAPVANVHRKIENTSTSLDKTGHVFKDGVLWLDWSAQDMIR